jgi:hypothetical protein
MANATCAVGAEQLEQMDEETSGQSFGRGNYFALWPSVAALLLPAACRSHDTLARDASAEKLGTLGLLASGRRMWRLRVGLGGDSRLLSIPTAWGPAPAARTAPFAGLRRTSAGAPIESRWARRSVARATRGILFSRNKRH